MGVGSGKSRCDLELSNGGRKQLIKFYLHLAPLFLPNQGGGSAFVAQEPHVPHPSSCTVGTESGLLPFFFVFAIAGGARTSELEPRTGLGHRMGLGHRGGISIGVGKGTKGESGRTGNSGSALSLAFSIAAGVIVEGLRSEMVSHNTSQRTFNLLISEASEAATLAAVSFVSASSILRPDISSSALSLSSASLA